MAETKQKVDVRTYSRYVEKGLLKDGDVQNYLKSLPDEAENAVWVDPTAEEAEVVENDEEAFEESEESEETDETVSAAHAQPVEEGT
jgi:hypothetical protein